MPVEIQIVFEDDSDSTILMMNENNNQYFVFTFSKKPTEVIFDPENKIPLKETSLIESTEDINSGIQNITLFPNPAHFETQLQYSLTQSAEVLIELQDLSGKTLHQLYNNFESEGIHVLRIPTYNLSAGFYFISIHANGSQKVLAFVAR